MAVVINGTTGVSGVDGSAGTPSYQGTDSNTGIFFPAADTIAFGEGGAEAMRIDSSGNVGIGTSSPAHKLQVAGAIAVTGTLGSIGVSSLVLENDSANTRARFIVAGPTASTYSNTIFASTYSDGSGYAERMRIDSSGNLCVGTTATAGSSRAIISGNTRQLALSDGTYNWYQVIGNNFWSIQSGEGTERARITSGGDVLINTTANVNNAKLKSKVSTGSFGLEVTDESQSDFVVAPLSGAVCRVGPTSGAMAFYTANSERARITSAGYLCLLTTSAAGYHKIYQSTASEITAEFKNESATNGYGIDVNSVTSAGTGFSFIRSYSNVNSSPDLEFNLRGDGNGYADGTWNNNGADYAEFFESANGQALTLGATVVLDGNKVREATSQDPASAIIGVVRPKEPSKASMVVGNTAWNKWANKYLTDDFDRYIMEDHDVVEWEEQVLEREAVAAVEAVVDEEGNEVSPAVPAQEAVYKTKQHSYESHNIPAGVTVPADAVRKTHDDKGNKFQHYKLNPAWDKDAEYVNRENRPEWNIIGLLGQVKILKGQPVGDRWIKMRDVSATVEEWMIR